MRETVKIDKSRISYLKEKIEKINKKARELGCREMTLEIGTEETVTYLLRDGRVVSELTENDKPVMVYVSVDATLDYEVPVIDGWELICTFDIMPVPDKNEHVVFTSKVPDKTLPAEFLNKTEIHCDHCGINRFRNHSILLRNLETGEYKEVGSTCVKDFFGHDPKGALFMAQFKFDNVIREVDTYCNNHQGYRMYTAYPLERYLEITAAVIRNYGWVSKGTAWDTGKMSTAENVDIEFDLLRKKSENALVPNDADKELAKATIEYFKNLDPEDNDYLTNCKKVVELGYVPNRMTGVACSTIVTYKRTLKVEKTDVPSEYVGNVGERINLSAECVYNMTLETMYGMSELYIFVTPAGEKVKTFYSGSKWSCEPGETYHLTGTVKKHEEYRNEKTTLLTRVSVVE